VNFVELRWACREGTTTEPPRLQYRQHGEWPATPGPWVDVPKVVVPDAADKETLCANCGRERKHHLNDQCTSPGGTRWFHQSRFQKGE
jgi:hypothetical protein